MRKLTVVMLGVIAFFGIAAGAMAIENSPEGMINECKSRTVTVFGGSVYEKINAKYEGRRSDGTQAVNGSVNVRGLETFQCSFDREGWTYTYRINTPKGAAEADGTPEAMVEKCSGRIAVIFGADFEEVESRYEGKRTDGTHAVNGSVRSDTFQCSYARGGRKIDYVIVNFPNKN